MNPHPLDPIALVSGLVAIVAGIIAVTHQSGGISLSLPVVIVLGLMVIGTCGATLVILESRRRRSPASPDVGR